MTLQITYFLKKTDPPMVGELYLFKIKEALTGLDVSGK